MRNRNLGIKILSLLIALVIISADVAVFADLVVEELVEEEESLIDNSSNKDDSIILEEEEKKGYKEEDNKFDKNVQLEEGNYLVRNILVGSKELIEEYSTEVDEYGYIEAKNYNDYILVSKSIVKPNEKEDKTIEFEYIKKLDDKLPIKQYIVRHVVEENGKLIDIYDPSIRLGIKNEKIVEKSLDLPGYNPYEDEVQGLLDDSMESLIIKYKKTNKVISLFDSLFNKKANMTDIYIELTGLNLDNNREINIFNTLEDDTINDLLNQGLIIEKDGKYYMDNISIVKDNTVYINKKNLYKLFISGYEYGNGQSIKVLDFLENEANKEDYKEKIIDRYIYWDDDLFLVDKNNKEELLEDNKLVVKNKIMDKRSIPEGHAPYKIEHIVKLEDSGNMEIVGNKYFIERIDTIIEASSLEDKGREYIFRNTEYTDLDGIKNTENKTESIKIQSLDDLDDEINRISFYYNLEREGNFRGLDSNYNPDNSILENMDYSLDFRDSMTNSKPDGKIKELVLDKYTSKSGVKIDRKAPEIEGYKILGNKRETIVLDQNHKKLIFNYIAKESEEEDNKAFFMVKHYKGEKLLETTTGSALIGDRIWSKDQVINYKGLKLDSFKKPYIELDKETENNIIELYYINGENTEETEPEDIGEHGNEQFDYEVIYSVVNGDEGELEEYNYKAQAARNTWVSVYGLQLDGYKLISKTPKRELIDEDNKKVYIKYIKDQSIDKKKGRYIERHLVRKSIEDSNGNQIDYYEDILEPRVLNANLKTNIQMNHKNIKGFKKLIEDDKENLEIMINNPNKVYELIAVYEEDLGNLMGEKPEDIDKDRDKNVDKSKEKTVYTINYLDYKTGNKIKEDKYEDFIDKIITIEHLEFIEDDDGNRYIPYIPNKNMDPEEIKEINLKKNPNDNILNIYYRQAGKTIDIDIEYIFEMKDGEDKIVKYKDRNVEIGGYISYLKYLELFENGNIIANPEDYKFKSASPEIIKLEANDEDYSMKLYFENKNDREPEKPIKPEETKYKTINIKYKTEEGNILRSRQERRKLNSWHYISGDEIIEYKDKRYELISRPLVKVQFKKDASDIEFIYREIYDEKDLERYYIRFVEEFKNSDSEKEYMDILDPITGQAELGDIVRVPELENKIIKDEDGKELYEFSRYMPESKIINISESGDNTAYYIFNRLEDSPGKLPEEPNEDKNKETNLKVQYMDSNKAEILKEYEFDVNKDIELEIHAKNRIKIKDDDYILISKSPKIFKEDAKKLDSSYIISFEYVKKSDDIKEDSEDKTLEDSYYIVRHVRKTDDGKIRDIVTPGIYSGFSGSELKISRLSDSILEDLYDGNYNYINASLNGNGKLDKSEIKVKLNKNKIQEIVFYYDLAKTDKDPEIIDKDEESSPLKDREYGVKETEISSEDNWTSEGKKISKTKFKTTYNASVTVFRENNFDLDGNIIDKSKYIGKDHILYSPSRQKIDFENEKMGNLPIVEFVYIKSNLGKLDSRVSVRYVQVEDQEEAEDHIRKIEEDDSGNYAMGLRDIKNRDIFKGNFVNGVVVNKLDRVLGLDGSEYIYVTDTGNGTGEADIVTGEFNKARVDYFIFMKKVDNQKFNQNYIQAMDNDYRYILEYKLDDDKLIQKIYGSDSKSLVAEALDLKNLGYELKEDQSEYIEIDNLLKGIQPMTPIDSFEYEKIEEGSEEIIDPEEELEEPEESEESGEDEESEEDKDEESEIEESEGSEELEDLDDKNDEEKEEIETENESNNYRPNKRPNTDKDEKEDDHTIDYDIDKLTVDKGIRYINGYSDNTVRPNANVSREEVATIIFRILNEDYRNHIRTDEHDFKDIDGIWSESNIASLTSIGVLEGFPNGEFRPKDTMTRAELTAVISRLNDLELIDENEFVDIEDHWARGYINSVKNKGWIKGYNDNTFRPGRPIKRSELITMINNMLDKKKDKGSPVKEFTDLEKDRWYYGDINSAVIY